MRRRKLWIALAVILVSAAIAAVVYLRSRAAPEAARLLPESDAVLFVNLRLMRLAHVFGEVPSVSYDPDYEQFVKDTGFQFERDLDQAAFAVHAPTAATQGNEGFFEGAHYSEIFIGKFDAQRATVFFGKLSSNTENYRDVVIYAIPQEGRTVRVAILGLDAVAVSNTPDTAAIHQMIDKYRAAAWPASGPSLVREHYRQVPLASVAWALASIPAQPARGPSLVLPGGLEMPLRWLAGSTIVGSARYLGALHLRIEALTQSETDAQQLLETTKTFFALLKSAESSTTQGGADADVKAFFDSLKVEEHGSRVALTATIPQGFIRKALTPPPSPPVAAPAPAPSQKPGKKSQSKKK
ncbi:MAG TPA: hypothetical protein VES66_09435 [Terriglobales bacterium]|nr:hypothetical protein [Terriglobales bacterium]